MFKDRLLNMVLLGIRQFRDPYYQGFAAQISFYLLLSIVPIFLLITELLKFFNISIESTVEWLVSYAGGTLSKTLQELLQSSSSATMNIVFIFIALWSASRVQFCIMRINNYTFSEGRSTGKGYFSERFRAMRTMLITLFTIAFALVILGYGELILSWIFDLINLKGESGEDFTQSVWLNLRWIVGFVLYFLMVSYNYYILPSNKVQFRQVLPGSVFASAGMLLVTLFYSKYTTNIANYDLLYGTLSSIVAVLFWFYFLAWVMCLGILVNKVWNDTSDYDNFSKRTPVKAPVRSKEW